MIDEACSAGAQQHLACAVIGLAARTVQRWLEAGKTALHVGGRHIPPDQLAHRRLEHVPQKHSKPRALLATQPDQICCWDIAYLPTQVRGLYFYLYLYLYLFVDIFSRKVVGWQVVDGEAPSGPQRCWRTSTGVKASAPIRSRCTQATAGP